MCWRLSMAVPRRSQRNTNDWWWSPGRGKGKSKRSQNMTRFYPSPSSWIKNTNIIVFSCVRSPKKFTRVESPLFYFPVGTWSLKLPSKGLSWKAETGGELNAPFAKNRLSRRIRLKSNFDCKLIHCLIIPQLQTQYQQSYFLHEKSQGLSCGSQVSRTVSWRFRFQDESLADNEELPDEFIDYS